METRYDRSTRRQVKQGHRQTPRSYRVRSPSFDLPFPTLLLITHFILTSPAAIPEYAYRKVYLTGEFDHANEILLGPRTRDGQLGFHVITPLVRGEGQDTILVNRGFVNRAHREKPERQESLVSFLSSSLCSAF